MAATAVALALVQQVPAPDAEPSLSPAQPADAPASGDVESLPVFADDTASARNLRIAGAVALVLLIGAGAMFGFRYRAGRGGRRHSVASERDEGGWPLQPLIVPPGLAQSDADAPFRARGPAQALRGPVAASRGAAAEAFPEPSGAPQLAIVPAAVVPARPRALRGRESAVLLPQPTPQEVRIGQVHFHRAPEGTLQLLPGKLEILGGPEPGEEIRFVRVPGREPVITFGRSDGEPHTHVRLDALTVSRLHAALRFQQGRWHVENRSRTNPVLVNGTPLPAAGGAPHALNDGDTLEMGEVTFRFRTR